MNDLLSKGLTKIRPPMFALFLWLSLLAAAVLPASASILEEEFVPKSDLICIAQEVSRPRVLSTNAVLPSSYEWSHGHPYTATQFTFAVQYTLKGDAPTDSIVNLIAFTPTAQFGDSGRVDIDFVGFTARRPWLLFLKKMADGRGYQLLRPGDRQETAYVCAPVRDLPASAFAGATPLEQIYGVMFYSLSDTDSKVHQDALRTLYHLGDLLQETGETDSGGIGYAAWKAYRSSGEGVWCLAFARDTVVPALRKRLATEKPVGDSGGGETTEKRKEWNDLIGTAANLQMVDAIPALIDAARREKTVGGTASFLRCFKTREAIPYMAQLLNSPDPIVREEVKWNAGNARDLRYVPFWGDVLTNTQATMDERYYVYGALALTVDQIGTAALKNPPDIAAPGQFPDSNPTAEEFSAHTEVYLSLWRNWERAHHQEIEALRREVLAAPALPVN